jgi:transcriptional regulator with XRE-family HTH domain
MSFNAEKFAKDVAAYIRSTDSSLREAALKIGLSAATLCRITNGEKPSIDAFVKICQAAGWTKNCDHFFIEQNKEELSDQEWEKRLSGVSDDYPNFD